MSKTKTSDFGSSKRESHDSSHFYSSKMYREITPSNTKPSNDIENEFPAQLINKIIQGDSRDLSFIPDHSLHLAVTSPPYNARKQYDEDLSLAEYLDLIEEVFALNIYCSVFQHFLFFSAFFVLQTNHVFLEVLTNV